MGWEPCSVLPQLPRRFSQAYSRSRRKQIGTRAAMAPSQMLAYGCITASCLMRGQYNRCEPRPASPLCISVNKTAAVPPVRPSLSQALWLKRLPLSSAGAGAGAGAGAAYCAAGPAGRGTAALPASGSGGAGDTRAAAGPAAAAARAAVTGLGAGMSRGTRTSKTSSACPRLQPASRAKGSSRSGAK